MRKRATLPSYELERHIMRCRRREEPASVLVARLPARVRISPERVLACFRLTDSVSIARIRDGYEIAGVFDEDGFERGASNCDSVPPWTGSTLGSAGCGSQTTG